MTTGQAYLTDRELAERYAVSRITIWRWVKRDQFPTPVRLGANCTRWRREDVDAWERERVEATAA